MCGLASCAVRAAVVPSTVVEQSHASNRRVSRSYPLLPRLYAWQASSRHSRHCRFRCLASAERDPQAPWTIGEYISKRKHHRTGPLVRNTSSVSTSILFQLTRRGLAKSADLPG